MVKMRLTPETTLVGLVVLVSHRSLGFQVSRPPPRALRPSATALSARGPSPASATALRVRGGGLLKGIDPLLTADLLYVLRAAGHGDTIAVVDCNFPAATVATETTSKKHVMLAGADIPEALGAISTVLPLDTFIPNPVGHMVPSPGMDLPELGAEVHAAGLSAVRSHCSGVGVEEIERYEFYAQAKKAFAVVQTAERRPYGCFLLTKGVVGPDGGDLVADAKQASTQASAIGSEADLNYSGTRVLGSAAVMSDDAAAVRAEVQGAAALAEAKQAGYSAAEAKQAGYSVVDLKQAGYTAADLKQAGYLAADVRQAGYSAAEAKQGGYTASEAKVAGYSAKEAKQAGYLSPWPYV